MTYQCKLCDYRTGIRKKIRAHVMDVHKRKCSKKSWISSDKYESDVSDAYKKV